MENEVKEIILINTFINGGFMQQNKCSLFFSHCVRRTKLSLFLTSVIIMVANPFKMYAMTNNAENQVDRELPITVAACTVGSNASGAWWFSMNAAGNAVVVIDSWPKRRKLEFTVPREKIVALRKAIAKERFFELKEDYGEYVFDSSSEILTIVEGEQYKTVQIHFLMNWVYNDPSKLEEPARALRIFMLIRDWFEDTEAFDLRKFDQKVLDTVEEREKLRAPQITNQTAVTGCQIQCSEKTNDLGTTDKRKKEIE